MYCAAFEMLAVLFEILIHGRQSYNIYIQMEDHWRIPVPTVDLPTAISELRGLARGGLDDEREGDG